jgi:hypothetical protein
VTPPREPVRPITYRQIQMCRARRVVLKYLGDSREFDWRLSSILTPYEFGL